MKNNIKIANAPCSWGALEFDLKGEPIGFKQMLDELVDTEYIGTELGDWGFMPTEPSLLRKEIISRNLDLIGAFVPISFVDPGAHQEGIEKAKKVAGLMYDAGFPNAFIVLADNNGTVEYRTKNAGRINPNDKLSAENMKVFGEGVNKVARALKESFNMRAVFHHHCGGYIEAPWEIESLLENTDPDLVGVCFDTGHYLFGGGTDLVDFLNRHWDRVHHVHFKDFSGKVAKASKEHNWDYFQSVQHGVFCELGKGDVDFKSVADFLRMKEYDGWIVVEQDVLPGMGNPKECAGNNRAYLKTLGL